MSNKQQDLNIEDARALYGADSVADYSFEPIKGYPMLNWRGKRPFTSTNYYPAQLKERHGDYQGNWINKIFWGDNLQVMSHLLKEYRGKVQLVYIDPPFDSKADYKKKVQLKGQSTTNDASAFEEKQYHDIWTNDEYLQFVYERVIIIKELLSKSGLLWLHCDWHKNYHLRSILEEIFGEFNFINEIIWQRTFSSAASRTINNIHDTSFVFCKSPDFIWNNIKTSPSQDYLDKRFTMEDPNGRKFQGISLTAPSISKGETGCSWRGFNPTTQGRHWAYKLETLEQLDLEGKIYWPQKTGGWPRLKRYVDEVDGIALQSIWTDISPVNSQANEDTGFPTQKPEALLERIIKASSNPDDIVFDCFMGSGTTQAVAMKLGRRFIGADINLGAVQISTKRLLGVAADIEDQQRQGSLATDDNAPDTYYTGFEVYNVNHYDVFRNPVQARDLLIEALELQPMPQGHVYDGEQDGFMVKIMPVNRIATRADLNDLIHNFDLKAFKRRNDEHPNQAVEKIRLVCMGHEPDLADALKKEALPYKIKVEVVDILRDRQDLQFKRDSEAQLSINGNTLSIDSFYPMNLLGKLSLEQEKVEDWRELVESIMIDWNYDGAVLEPAVTDIPSKKELVKGTYTIPADAGTIRVKITDVLSESWEGEINDG